MLAVLGYARSTSWSTPRCRGRDRTATTPLGLEPTAAPSTRCSPSCGSSPAATSVLTSMIGLGYYGTVTPPVILRNVLENPAWYTAYTPYQPEISQGRLEALLNFQTVVTDLTGLPVAGASLLDEATAAAEAMTLARRASKARERRGVRRRRATAAADAGRGADPRRAAGHRRGRRRPVTRTACPDGDVFGVLLQYPGTGGAVRDLAAVIDGRARAGALVVVVAADLLALTLLRAPGEWAPTSRSAPPSASACRWASAARTPATWRSARVWSASCPAAWSASPGTPTASPRTGWRCRPASSTSAARRRPATSAPRRCCSPSWPACTPSTTARRGCGRSRAGCTATPPCWPPALADGGGRRDGPRAASSTPSLVRVPGRAAEVVAAAARARASTCGLVDADHVGVSTDETTTPRAPARGVGRRSALTDRSTPDERRRPAADALPDELLRRDERRS